MKKSFKVFKTVIIVLFFVTGVFYHFWTKKQFKSEIENNNTTFTSTVQFYSDSLSNVISQLNKAGDTIKFVRQDNMSLEAMVAAGLIKEKELENDLMKSIETITKLEEKIVILNQDGTYVEPPVVNLIDSADCVEFPFKMNFGDDYYKLTVTAALPNPVLNSLRIFSNPTIKLGFHKDPGFKNVLKRKYPVATYSNDNPYIQLNDMIHVNVTQGEKFYETTWFKLTTGFVGGAFFGYVVFK
jgi:hypothetical protein